MNKPSDILTEAATREAEIESGEVTPLTESEIWAATDAARQTIHKNRSISLDETGSQRFVDALFAAPCNPIQRFNQALNTCRESVVER